MKNLDGLTIEDLRLILAIVEEGSLTAGAGRMRLGQSNASYSLKKIQSAFRTDLFLRKGRKLVPSEFGWHVYHRTKAMLDDFQSVINPPAFDPASEFSLQFGATEYETVVVFPRMLKLLNTHAPKAKIHIFALDTKDISGQLERLDFIFAPVDIASSSISTLKVFEDHIVTIYDETKRVAPSSLENFITARHAIASFNGSLKTDIDEMLADKKLSRNVAMSVFGFAALAGLMRGTDLITTLPGGLTNSLFSGFASCKCPLNPPPMILCLCWEVAKEERGKISWFIELMKQNSGDLA